MILDDIEAQKKLDVSQTYESILSYSEQCQHAFEETVHIQLPDSYHSFNKILMCGMGGSGLGARIIESLYGLQIRCPIIHMHDYDLPAWVDQNTLCIFSAFSGTTEEPLECARQAIKRGLKWMAIGSGDTLINLAIEQKVPYYKINPTFNPSKQPRLALGYSIIGQIRLLASTGILIFDTNELQSIKKAMQTVISSSKREIPFENNPVKKIAQALSTKQVVFVASRHLVGAAHAVKNQMNENAKSMSSIQEIPELNHHLMEGLAFPKSNVETLLYVFINSSLYPERIQKRFLITKDIIEKNHIPTMTITPQSNNMLTQAFELLQLGGFINYYLSMLHGVDPAPIPYVDEFKIRLGQSLGIWK